METEQLYSLRETGDVALETYCPHEFRLFQISWWGDSAGSIGDVYKTRQEALHYAFQWAADQIKEYHSRNRT